MERYIKARLSGSKVFVSSTAFMYPSIYISYVIMYKEGRGTKLVITQLNAGIIEKSYNF